MTNIDKLKKKIAALKAKTRANGCTEAEAMAAAALAAKLMAEHGLTETDIAFVTARERVSKTMPRWQRWLAHAICNSTNTHAITIMGDIREIEFAGKEHAVEIALYLRDVLTRAINAEIRKLRASTPYRRLRKSSSKEDMVKNFAAGMVSRLAQKLHDLFAQSINATEQASAKLILQERYADAKPPRSSSPFKVNHAAAYLAGRGAAETVNLAHGVSGAGGAPKLIGSGS